MMRHKLKQLKVVNGGCYTSVYPNADIELRLGSIVTKYGNGVVVVGAIRREREKSKSNAANPAERLKT